MPQSDCLFLDVSEVAAREDTLREKSPWGPIIIPKAAIDSEIERLADAPRPADGQRGGVVVHPQSQLPGLGLAPGVDVTINVLKPGESTTALRRNANQIEMCIGGTGSVIIDGNPLAFEKWDVWNIPSMQTYTHRNDGNDLMVRLSYSNTPLLRKLAAYYTERNPQPLSETMLEKSKKIESDIQKARYARDSAPNFDITGAGAWMRGYEYLVDIEVVENKALLWPWKQTAPHLPLQAGDNKRPIYLLYNPATERRNGTTHSFFATLAASPPNAKFRPVGRGHRHSSVAINYYFQGSGKSVVDGETYVWSAGDLMLSAPSWFEHAHYHDAGGSATLTVQDHPQQIGMESLTWQEDIDGPILALGSQAGITGYTGPRERGE